MATQRAQIVAAVITALDGAGKPGGLTVLSRAARAQEVDALPSVMVTRAKEQVQRAIPTMLRSPLVDRYLTVRIDLRVTDSSSTPDAEAALEPLLAWTTAAMLTDPGFGGLAIDTTEESTEWELDEENVPLGHAWMEFTIRFSTKTADQEQRQ